MADGCVCNRDKEGAILIQCGSKKCKRWWHVDCAGLSGITEDCIDKIKYTCPICVSKSLGFSDATPTNENIGAVVQTELKKSLPKKKATAVASKSYADCFKKESSEKQASIIKETVKETSGLALVESMKRTDSNLMQQRQGSRNVVISGLNETEQEDPKQIAYSIIGKELAGFQLNDILNCYRIGRKNSGNTDGGRSNRLLLVILKSEEVVSELHNFGRGRRVDGGVWINKDMTRTEREILYQQRKAKRDKKQGDARPNI